MLQGEVEAILKDPGLNPFAGGRRQERFIAYSEPTELPPDELANGNWMRMPTVEVDRTGHEFLTDEELRTVRATGEQREVRYAPQGTFLMMHPSLVWGHVGWLETVQEWFAVDTSAVACLPVDKETLEGKVESIKRLRIRDGQLRQNLLKGRIAAGLTLPMVEAALGPLDILAPGWHGDALVQERRSRSAQERLHLRFEDGILTTWKAE